MSHSEYIERAEEATLEVSGAEYFGAELEELLTDNEQFLALASALHDLRYANEMADASKGTYQYKEQIVEVRTKLKHLFQKLAQENDIEIEVFTGTVVSTNEEVVLDDGLVMQKYDKNHFEDELPNLGSLVTIDRKENGLNVTEKEVE